MNHPEQKKKNLVKRISAASFVLLAVFVASRIIPILRGPEIKINTLPQSSELSNAMITLSGTATRYKKTHPQWYNSCYPLAARLVKRYCYFLDITLSPLIV
jgi:hypothetical protein